jgi:hypothetical protein
MMSSSRLIGSRRKGKTPASAKLLQYLETGFPEESPPPAAPSLKKVPVRSRPRRRALVVAATHPRNGALAARLCVSLGFDEVDVIGAEGARLSGEEYRRRRGEPREATATRAAIMSGLVWLVSGAIPGDSLALFYTGRGAGVYGAGGLEGEALVPTDYEAAGVIGEATLREYLFEPARDAGATLRVVLDMDDTGVGVVLDHNAYDASAAAAPPVAATEHEREVYERFAARGMAVPAPAPPPRWVEWAADGKPKEVEALAAPKTATPQVCVLMATRPVLTEAIWRRGADAAVADLLRDGRRAGADRVQAGCSEPVGGAAVFIGRV